MTMNLNRHGTKRAGFKDWPTHINSPGVDEPQIARCSYPDPDWVKELPPRRYEKGKTPTGEMIGLKIGDLRLRKDLTGTTHIPRLMKKTNPKEIEYQEVVDF